jgi:hypothetical protein
MRRTPPPASSGPKARERENAATISTTPIPATVHERFETRRIALDHTSLLGPIFWVAPDRRGVSHAVIRVQVALAGSTAEASGTDRYQGRTVPSPKRDDKVRTSPQELPSIAPGSLLPGEKRK